jgi:hypothetical protein
MAREELGLATASAADMQRTARQFATDADRMAQAALPGSATYNAANLSHGAPSTPVRPKLSNAQIAEVQDWLKRADPRDPEYEKTRRNLQSALGGN